jgi:putative DNA primase/helicase
MDSIPQSGAQGATHPQPIWAKLEEQPGFRETRPGIAKACCPAHDDHDPSLSIGIRDDGKVQLYCHVGCEYMAILEALSARWQDAWPNGTPPGEKRYEIKNRHGVTQDTQDTHQRYYDRTTGKKKMPWLKGSPRASLPLYGTEKTKDMVSGAQVVLCEGEPAADALNSRHVLAVATVTGADDVPCDESLLVLRKFVVILWADNDDIGREHMEKIAAALKRLGIEYHWLKWDDAPPKGDAVEFFAFGGTIEELPALICSSSDDVVHQKNVSKIGDVEQDRRVGELLSDVKPEQVEWLWRGYIPLGKLTIVDGDPGLGKTLVSGDLAARVTTGGAMPDDSAGIDAAGVVYFTAEDDPGDTLRPRAEAAGADLSRFLVVQTITVETGENGKTVERLPTFRDTAFLRAAVDRVGAKIVIYDPFMAYLSGETNSFRDQDVRAELAPLAMLAQELGVAIVLIRHLNKGTSGNALYRGGGSIGIIGAARSGLMIAQHPDDESRRVLSSQKLNLAARPASLEYSIDAIGDGAPTVLWHGVSQYSATEIATTYSRMSDEDRSALDDAVDFLREELSSGPQPAPDIERSAERVGISKATLRRAKEKLGLKAYREGGLGREGKWMLPFVPILRNYLVHPQHDEQDSAETGSNGAKAADSHHLAQVILDEQDSEQDSAADVLTLIDLQPGVGIGIAPNVTLHIVDSGPVTMQSNSALVAAAEVVKSGEGGKKRWAS